MNDGNFLFFKQKTAYEFEYGLGGSEMCIRDRRWATGAAARRRHCRRRHSVRRREQPATGLDVVLRERHAGRPGAMRASIGWSALTTGLMSLLLAVGPVGASGLATVGGLGPSTTEDLTGPAGPNPPRTSLPEGTPVVDTTAGPGRPNPDGRGRAPRGVGAGRPFLTTSPAPARSRVAPSGSSIIKKQKNHK